MLPHACATHARRLLLVHVCDMLFAVVKFCRQGRQDLPVGACGAIEKPVGDTLQEDGGPSPVADDVHSQQHGPYAPACCVELGTKHRCGDGWPIRCIRSYKERNPNAKPSSGLIKSGQMPGKVKA